MRHILLLGAGVLVSTSATAQLTVTATTPLLHAGNVAPNASIVVDFDRAVDATTLDEFRVWGSISGPIRGAFALELGGARVRFQPLRTFGAGEVVQFSLSNALRAADGSFLRAQGYASSFRIVTAPANMVFTPIAAWDPDPTTFARIYGAHACDFNRDEYADLAIVCQNTSDVRVFLNEADGSGDFGALASAPYATGAWPSPNENGDLDGDGFVDMVTCNTQGDSFTVLLGNGNGTFQRAATYSMGSGPHGVALLDVDGDGDLDVATANIGSNNLALRRNNGNGTFGPVAFVPSVLDGTYALAAADMNNDNIVDLVVGARFSTNICVYLSNGDGTFAPQTPVSTGGQTWMIACGDVDGDRNMDVSSANGPTGNGAIVRGNGAGGLFPAAVLPGAGWMTATDLGDLDGDGDLDWVLSSFGGGRWTIYRNNGLGAMSLQQTIFATDSPACATLFDIDRDGDLDLALLDELADLCTIYENGALDATTFCAGDGSGATCPCANVGANGHGCAHSTPTGGALLNAQGNASIASDSLSLAVSGLPATATALLFQGVNATGGGGGVPFKDGVKCVGAPQLRLGLRSAVNGYCVWGDMVGDAPLSLSGGIAPAGGAMHYQVWFRDPNSPCTNSGVNLSNGVRVTWTL